MCVCVSVCVCITALSVSLCLAYVQRVEINLTIQLSNHPTIQLSNKLPVFLLPKAAQTLVFFLAFNIETRSIFVFLFIDFLIEVAILHVFLFFAIFRFLVSLIFRIENFNNNNNNNKAKIWKENYYIFF